MKLRNGLRLGLASTLLLTATRASALELVRYDFNEGSPSATTTGTITGTDIVSGPFSGGTNGSSAPTIDASGFTVYADRTYTPSPGTDALVDALTKGDYLSFTVDSTSITPFSISEIRFNYSAKALGFSMSSHLLAKATGATTFTASDLLLTANFFNIDDSDEFPVDVSANSALQNLTGPVEFRIYFSDSTFDVDPSHQIDTIVVSGVVPEPGSLALLGLGGVCLLWRRRPMHQ